MKLMPAFWRRSRRGLYRAVAVIGAFAAVAGGLTAVTAAPARADQTITSGGPYAVTYSGGDVVASEDVPGVAPADVSNLLTTTWPQAVGLSAGASLTAIYRATWQEFSSTWQANPSAQGFPEPPDSSGGSASVSSDGSGGTTLNIDIPAAAVSANITVPLWLQTALGQAAGILAAAASLAICEPTVIAVGGVALGTTGPGGIVLTAAGTRICGGFAAAMWTFFSSVVGHAFSNQPWTGEVWLSLVSASLTAFVGGAFVAKWVPAVRWILLKLVGWIPGAIVNIVGFIKPYVSDAWQDFLASVQRFMRRGEQQVEDGLPMWNLPNIPVTDGRIVDRGFFEAYPFGGAAVAAGTSSYCMDAYGSGGNPSAGQAVAINTCDQGASQLSDVYPDGMVSIGGLCLDIQGGTSSLGTQLVNLEPCDDSANQVWAQVGSTVVNKATSDCLDEPNGSTTPGTQLDISPCNGSPAQAWLGPAGQPCDIYAANGTACTAAYSMTRAMYAAYGGPLYQVKRSSDGTTANIGLLAAGFDVNAPAQDSFCAGTACTITEIYDQSPMGNNLTVAPGGGAAPNPDNPADATALPITIGGHEAYGVDIEPGMGYRNNTTQGIATNGEPEGMYMVASGTHANPACCFDFGNGEANSDDNTGGHMDAVNLSTTCWPGGQCTGNGPWVQADLEDGLFMGANNTNLANLGNSTDFVTALLKNNGQTTFALKGGDSQSGGLSTWYDGPLPGGLYTPMKQEGGIILGTGGDNSNWGVGSFFEGVMTAGYPTDAADNAVQANIVAAGYAGNSAGVNAVASAAGPAVAHDGYASVYTVTSGGHLQETYDPAIGQPWVTQDMFVKFHTPPVMAGTEPVAVTHDGYTSVYTVDAGGGDGPAAGDLQETYLSAIGAGWVTQDLSALAGTPPTDLTPTAVYHDGYTSVYTVTRSDRHLQETYLPALGAGWRTQDLSGLTSGPAVLAGTSPVAVYHDGYTSVYAVNGADHLQETFLPALGAGWQTQDMKAKFGTPDTTVTPAAVHHSGYTSVYTVDKGDDGPAAGDLQETFLQAIGDPWDTQDMSAKFGTPTVAPGTSPVALFHTGYTSVYTVDQGSDHLQETFLPAIGDPWTSQDMNAKFGTPPTAETPIVLLHADATGALTWTSVYTFNEDTDDLQETYLTAIGDPWVTKTLSATPPAADPDSPPAAAAAVAHDGYASVYTVDTNGDLQETYLTAAGQPWTTQNLTTLTSGPSVMPGTKPVAVTHDGYTSVYTIDTNGHLQETWLPAIGQAWVTQDLSAKAGTPSANTTPAAVLHDGYTSVYTVDAANGHLQETWLSALGGSWVTQDLLAKAGTPPAEAGTSPAVVFHSGYTSVYTVDASHDLQETYLPALGAAWITQDLSAKAGTPPTSWTPAAVFHNGYTSVYTVDDPSRDLQETYLPAIGDSWSTQDMSVKFGTPPVASGTQPVAIYHTGYASVYTVDQGSDHLQETYLTAVADPWTTQDLSSKAGVPATVETPVALVHADASGGLTWTSVYTIDEATDHLRETYLQALGDPWVTKDLTALTGGPPDAATDDPTAGSSVIHEGYTSVYTVDANGDLQETYLTAAGQPWVTQDLTKLTSGPAVRSGTQPTAVTHDGYTSVYTIDTNGDLQETWLSALGQAWATQDLSSTTHTPASNASPAVVYHSGYTSVYTVDGSNGNLWETYLPALGAGWTAQNLTANAGTPAVDAYTYPGRRLPRRVHQRVHGRCGDR